MTSTVNLTVPGLGIDDWMSSLGQVRGSRPTTPLPPGAPPCPTHKLSANDLEGQYTEPRDYYSTDFMLCGKCVDKFTHAREATIKKAYDKLRDVILTSSQKILETDKAIHAYNFNLTKNTDAEQREYGELLTMSVGTHIPPESAAPTFNYIRRFLTESSNDMVHHIEQMGDGLKEVSGPEWEYKDDNDGFVYSVIRSDDDYDTLLVEIRSGLLQEVDDEMEE